MATPELPQGHSHDDGNKAEDRPHERSRLEEMLVKSSIWKRRTLQDIEVNRALTERAHDENDEQPMDRLLVRLSAQLDERNDEIEQLRRTVTKLENEKSRLTRTHQRELELQRAELERLQDAYDQFERESDDLLSELGQQNKRLRDECRQQNTRSLLK